MPSRIPIELMNQTTTRRVGELVFLLSLCLLLLGPSSSVVAWSCASLRYRHPTTTTTTTTTTSTQLHLAPQQLGTFESLNVSPEARKQRTVRVESYLEPHLDYQAGWDRQGELWQAHADRLLEQQRRGKDDTRTTTTTTTTTGTTTMTSSSLQQFDGYDTIVMVQHKPIYTLGTASDTNFIKSTAVAPVQRINRGGQVTYHGPGQLTVYPIIDLRAYNQDIHWYMRALEQVVLQAVAAVGVPDAMRDDDTTGVWVRGYKVAAVGVHARKWITQHGLAINVTPESLQAFEHIVPCGLEGRKVGCVQQFTNQEVTVEIMAEAVKQALQDVFGVQLVVAQCD